MDYNTQLKNQPSWLIDTDARYNSSLPNLCSQAVTQGKPLLLTRAAWTFIVNFTCGAKHIEMLYGASIKPGVDGSSNPVNMNIAGSFNAPIVKVFDYSLGGTIKFTGAIPTVHPEWWGGGVNDATIDTAAESAAVGAISNNTTPCGTIMHIANRVYALGAVTAITCGILDGNGAIIKPSTSGTVFTAAAGTPASGTVLQAPIFENFNFETGTVAAANLIYNLSAVNTVIRNNTFGVITAQYGIHSLAFGTKVRDNNFRSGNTWTGAAVFADNTNGAANNIIVDGNDFTQQTGLCILTSGGIRQSFTNNILEGCTAGGWSWNGASSLYGFNYWNYNEANTNFDISFADSASRANGTIVDSGFNGTNCTNCIIISKNTTVTISHSILDGVCVDTNALTVSSEAHYVSDKNISFDSPAGCNVLTEATSNLLARIPNDFTFFWNEAHYSNPITLYVNLPLCDINKLGYEVTIANGNTSNSWGAGVGSTGTAPQKLICSFQSPTYLFTVISK